jgi:hypothetical protein
MRRFHSDIDVENFSSWRVLRFLKYPPRYRVCHPRMGRDLNFTDTVEKRQKLTEMFAEEEKIGRQVSTTSPP